MALEDGEMMNEYSPEHRMPTKWDVLTAWIMAATVVAGIAAFGPQVNVDMEIFTGTMFSGLFSG